jgi:DNA primase
MIAAEIAARLGGAYRSGAWWRCRCPVHSSGGATLALRDGDRGGPIAVCHAGCSRSDILAELCRRSLIDGGICREDERPAQVTIDNDGAARRIALAQRIWKAARAARESPVAVYLAGRGITIPLPPSLRWAPVLRRADGTCGPAMVARIDNGDGELIGVHRTWLDHDAAGYGGGATAQCSAVPVAVRCGWQCPSKTIRC